MNNIRIGATKLVLAAVGVSAFVAAGALGGVLDHPAADSTAVATSEMQLGQTSTQTAAANAPETSIAVPPVKAKPYGGS